MLYLLDIHLISASPQTIKNLFVARLDSVANPDFTIHKEHLSAEIEIERVAIVSCGSFGRIIE